MAEEQATETLAQNSPPQADRPAPQPPAAAAVVASDGPVPPANTKGTAVGLWWAVLTAAAIATSYLLAHMEAGHGAAMAGVWATHNLVGWTITLRAIRRGRNRSSAGRQTIETWCVALAAAWAIVASAVWSTALAEWATMTVIQLVVGLSLASMGAAMRDAPSSVGGLVLVVSAPMLLALGEGADPGLWSLLLIALTMTVSIVSVSLGWRRMRIRVQRSRDT